jgi:hypothetical protein
MLLPAPLGIVHILRRTGVSGLMSGYWQSNGSCEDSRLLAPSWLQGCSEGAGLPVNC